MQRLGFRVYRVYPNYAQSNGRDHGKSAGLGSYKGFTRVPTNITVLEVLDKFLVRGTSWYLAWTSKLILPIIQASLNPKCATSRTPGLSTG